MLFFYYIINIFENYLDNFFCFFYEEGEQNPSFDFLGLEREGLILRDILADSQNFNEFFYSLNEFFKSSFIYRIFQKTYTHIWLTFFIFSDIFFFSFVFLLSHLGVADRLFKDYIHNKERREILLVLNGFFFFCAFVFFFGAML